MRVVDLRSDTVTQPTPAMREAMYRAEVGDDGWRDDPTVIRLEELAAEKLGKEAAVFVASGTMGNLMAVLTHCGRGDEAILGGDSHIFWNEVGGISALGGVHVRTVGNAPDGTMSLDDLRTAVRADNIHFPHTRLLCLENTHNRCNGSVLTPEYTRSVAELAHGLGAKVHLDGARVFNAAVAQGLPVSALAKDVDSVQFCLTKGLSAPVGSLLCSSAPFILEARRWRQMVGGGMRQAGVIAAAGIVALETMVDRLAEDHDHARYLAQQLADIPGVLIDPTTIQSNIVIFRLEGIASEAFIKRLADAGVKVSNYWGGLVRMVTHYGIERDDVDAALEVIRRVMAGSE